MSNNGFFVRCVDCMGSDTTIVNAARVSYGQEVEEMGDKDIRLVKYLAKHNHTSPFRHVMVQLHIRCSEMIARQLYKHVVGIECISGDATKDHAWNEISGRYVELDTDFWVPNEWRSLPGKGQSKQGSGKPVDLESQEEAFRLYTKAMTVSKEAYNGLLSVGVCKEQARCVLPMAFNTEFYWTASLQAMVNVVKLRNKPDAQREVQVIGAEIEKIIRDKFPIAAAAMLDLE